MRSSSRVTPAGASTNLTSGINGMTTHTKRKIPHKNCRHDQALLFRTRNYLCRQGLALAGTRQLRPQGLVPVHAHRTEGVTASEGREGAHGVGRGTGVEGGNGDGNGVGCGNGDGDGTETGTEVKANEGAQDGNEDGSGDGAGTGTGTGVETRGGTQDENGDRGGDGNGNESSSGDENGGENGSGNENKDRIAEGGREAKKRKKPHESCRRDVGNGGGGAWVESGKRVDKKGYVQELPTQIV